MPKKPKDNPNPTRPIRAADGISAEYLGGDDELADLKWTVELTVPQMAAAQHACDMVIGTLAGMLTDKYVERQPGTIRLKNTEGANKAEQAQLALLALMLSTMDSLVVASTPLHLEPVAGGVVVSNNPGPVEDGKVN